MPETPRKSTLLSKFCKVGGTFLGSIPEDILKDILKNVTVNAVKAAAGSAAGAALIAGMPLWPVALALAAGGVGLMVLKGGKDSSAASGVKIDEIQRIIESLPDKPPTAKEFQKQAEQLGISVGNVQENVDALRMLLEIRDNKMFAEIRVQHKELEQFFKNLNQRLDLFDNKFNEIIHILTGGPRFDSFADKVPTQNRYLYSRERVDLFGRDDECKKLQNFLEDRRPVAWQLITGPGGMGKSRLAFHLCREAQQRGWVAGKVDIDSHFESWDHWQPKADTLLFFDYVEARMNLLAPHLQRLCKRQDSAKKIRILLVARQSDTGWLNTFLGDENTAAYVKDVCKVGELVLNPLSDEALWQIITEVVRIREKEDGLPATVHAANQIEVRGKRYSKTQLLSELNVIDGKKRPLFAAMAADAIMDGQLTRNWNRTDLLEHILRHEKHLWARYAESNHINEAKYRNLILLSTLCRGFQLYDQNGDSFLKKLPDVMANQLPDVTENPDVHLRNLLENDSKSDWLPFLEPDLLGEAFVLDQLKQDSYHRTKEVFFRTAVRNNGFGTALFVGMSHSDNKEDETVTFLLSVPPRETPDPVEALAWAKYVLGLSGLLPLSCYIDHFQKIWDSGNKNFPQAPEINLRLAQCAFNMSVRYLTANLPDNAEDCYLKLQKLSGKFTDNEEINLALANCAFNMCLHNGIAKLPVKAEGCYRELQKLAAKFPGNEEINLALAQCAFNMSVRYGTTNLPEAEGCYRELQKLAAKFPDNKEINLALAQCAFNISFDYRTTNLPEAEGCYRQLQKLVAKFPDNKEINLALAKCAFNMSVHDGTANLPEAEGCYLELQKLAAKFPDNKEINLTLAKYAFNMSVHYGTTNLPEAEGCYRQLQKLANKFPNSEEINLQLAKCAFNISLDYKTANFLVKAEGYYRELQKLADKFTDNEEINLQLAKCAFNMSVHDGTANLSEAEGGYQKLQKLANKFPNSEEINLELAKCAFNMSVDYETANFPGKAQGCYRQLQKLAGKFPDSEEINLALANCVFNMHNHYGTADKTEGCYQELQKLAGIFPDNEGIILTLAKCAANMSVRYGTTNLPEAEGCYRQLQKLAGKFPDNEEINLALANCAFNMCLLCREFPQKAAQIYNSLAKLCIARLNDEHTDFFEPWARGFFCIMGIPHYPYPEGTEQIQREFQAFPELTGETVVSLMLRYHRLVKE